MSANSILSVIGGLGGLAAIITVAVSIYRARADREQVESITGLNEANAVKVLGEATVYIMNPLVEDNKALRARLTEVERKLREHAMAIAAKEIENDQLRRDLHHERETGEMAARSNQQVINDLTERLRRLENQRPQDGNRTQWT